MDMVVPTGKVLFWGRGLSMLSFPSTGRSGRVKEMRGSLPQNIEAILINQVYVVTVSVCILTVESWPSLMKFKLGSIMIDSTETQV